jgi:hypothetical protein
MTEQRQTALQRYQERLARYLRIANAKAREQPDQRKVETKPKLLQAAV